MATIGTFTKSDNGSLVGTVRTLTVNAKTRFAPALEKSQAATEAIMARDCPPSSLCPRRSPPGYQQAPSRVPPPGPRRISTELALLRTGPVQ